MAVGYRDAGEDSCSRKRRVCHRLRQGSSLWQQFVFYERLEVEGASLFPSSIACYHFVIVPAGIFTPLYLGGTDALASLRDNCDRYCRGKRTARRHVCRGYAATKIGPEDRAIRYSDRGTGSFGGPVGEEPDNDANAWRSESFRPFYARSERRANIVRAPRKQLGVI